MGEETLDTRVRAAAFAFLTEQVQVRGEVLPRALLERGFSFEDHRVPLLGPQGIFKPAVLRDCPLSITTVPVVEGRARPYEDEMDEKGLLRYRYRGTDPGHHDNRGLRLAMERQVPLVYLYGIVPGAYMPVWPAFVVGDDPADLCFEVAVDDRVAVVAGGPDSWLVAEGRRSYVTRITVVRLHQQSFRRRVLRAYRECCAVCRLRHDELLEAAHILPDGHPMGFPVIPNGLALCKLHHAAFDRHVIGIGPDLKVEVRRDILEEPDGPMLEHGLKLFHGNLITVPRAAPLRPNRDYLAERFEIFRKGA